MSKAISYAQREREFFEACTALSEAGAAYLEGWMETGDLALEAAVMDAIRRYRAAERALRKAKKRT